MASQVFNEFKRGNAAGEIDLNADDMRFSIHMTNTTIDTENSSVTTNTNFTTSDEMDGSNYTTGGYALANEAVNKDDPNNRAEFDADDPATINSLGNGTREMQGDLFFKFVTNWASSIPCFWVEFSSTINPGGSDFSQTWDAEGIAQFS